MTESYGKAGARTGCGSRRPLPRSRFSWFLLAVASTVVLVPLLLLLLVHLPWIQSRIIEKVVAVVERDTGFRVSLERFRWNPLSRLSLRGLAVRDPSGLEVIRCGTAEVRYAFSAGAPYVDLRYIILERPFLRFEKDASGRWRVPGTGESGREVAQGDRKLWQEWPLPPIRVVEGRLVGLHEGKTVFSVDRVDGLMTFTVDEESGSPVLDIRFDQWGGEFIEPKLGRAQVEGNVRLAPGWVSWHAVEAAVGPDNRVRLDGRWHFEDGGPAEVQVEIRSLSPTVFTREASPRTMPSAFQGNLSVKRDTGGRWVAACDLRSDRGAISGEGFIETSREGVHVAWESRFAGVRATLPGRNIPVALDGTMEISGRGPVLKETTLLWKLAVTKGSAGAETIEAGFLEGAIGAGALEVHRLDLDSTVGGFHAAGAIRFEFAPGQERNGRLPIFHELEYEATQVDLGKASALAGVGELSGKLASRGRISGTWPALQWEGRMNLSDARYSDIQADRVDLSGNGVLGVKEGEKTLNIRATGMNLRGTRLRSVSVELEQEAAVCRFSAAGEVFEEEGSFSVSGRVENIWDVPRILTLQGGRLQWGDKTLQFSGSARAGGDRLDGLRLELVRAAERLTLTGSLAREKPTDLDVELVGFQPKEWPELADLFGGSNSLDGTVSGRAHVSGALSNPHVRFEVEWMDLRYAKASFDRAAFSGTASGGLLEFRGRLAVDSEEEPIEVTGNVPVVFSLYPFRAQWVASREGAIRAAGTNVRIEPFAGLVPHTRTVTGSATFQAELRISPHGSALEAEGLVEAGSVLLTFWSHPLENVRFHWKADSETIVIRDAVLNTLDGRVTLSAMVRHRNGKLEEATLVAQGTDLVFPELFGISGEGSGRARLVQRGPVAAPVIEAEVTFTKAAMYLGELELDLARNIQVIGGDDDDMSGITEVTSEKEATSSLYRRTALDVALVLPRDGAWVRGKGLEAEIQGEVQLKKEAAGPLRLFGTVQAVRGTYSFQSVRLKITEGELHFMGHERPDPVLQVLCQKDVRDASVFVRLTGPLSSPQLDFSSVPSMDRVDILSYLLFGRPAGELSAQQSTALQERGALLFGSETTKLLKAILGHTPFAPDVVQFKGTEEGSGIVEIGKYLTPELYVTYEKGLTADENDQVRAEFEMNRHISVQSQFGREDQSGVDVFFRYDFGD